MRVSTTQFSLQPITYDEQFWMRVESLIQQAVNEQSTVILFPEYFSLSWLVFKFGKETFRKNLEESHHIIPEFTEKFQKLSKHYQIVIIAGTVPANEYQNEKTIFNRSFIFQPHQTSHQSPLYQDKIHMTRFENEEWKITAGEMQLQTFKVEEALCAVATCYDIEFPAIGALAAEQGVEILFVPSCTDDVHGYWRVRLCAQARTIENQCYVVMSSIVGGDLQWPEIEFHYGQGGIYTPSDIGMPEGGIQKLGQLNQEGVITDEINMSELHRIREDGTVLNLRDLKIK